MMGLFGSAMGSAVGDVIGGSDGALFEQAFSGVMNNALTADSGAEVMTGTMTALGQSSGLMDSGTASMLGMAGSLFGGGGSSAAQTTSSGAIQRPQATQQQIAVPQQSAPLGQPSNYTFSCPMGSGPHTIPVPASNNPQCITAMRTFAYTATCNLIDEMGPAQDAYYSQCAAEIYN
ncbi:hypothetical protein FHS89_001108 [Rubricella aquisinus]|uniref:Uncharacterized protein n=1 Tax=Rubricella aquisinus TaxID=2028108 RepID=A0A840WJ11_9RHOB|nr:hypothetical protein [Rubricella aquisinus]MBB5515098.1 hypothetical protein [Rubricella aquisinus]